MDMGREESEQIEGDELLHQLENELDMSQLFDEYTSDGGGELQCFRWPYRSTGYVANMEEPTDIEVDREVEVLMQELMNILGTDISKHLYEATIDVEEENDKVCCSYCPFSHFDILFVLTHEVIAHEAELLAEVRDAGVTKKFYKYSIDRNAQSRITCRLCNCYVGSHSKFIGHLSSHLIPTNYPCSSCTYFTSTPSALGNHFKSHSTQNKVVMQAITMAMKYSKEGAGVNEESQKIVDFKKIWGDAEAIKNPQNGQNQFCGGQKSKVKTVKEDKEEIVWSDVTRCLFCHFTHGKPLFIFTHEVLMHSEALLEKLAGPEFEVFFKRYFCKNGSDWSCNLCQSAYVKPKNRSVHLKHHMTLGVECTYCTYSIENSWASSYLTHHTLRHTSPKKSEAFIEAKQFVRNANIVLESDPVGLIDAAKNKIVKTLPLEEGKKQVVKERRKTDSQKRSHQFIEEKKSKAMKLEEAKGKMCIAASPVDKCLFCQFSHANAVFVLTHEVLIHSEVIMDQLMAPTCKDLIKRYFNRKIPKLNWSCNLCECESIRAHKRIGHFKHHLVFLGLECRFCTYSLPLESKSGIASHTLRHTSQLKSQGFLDAKRFARSSLGSNIVEVTETAQDTFVQDVETTKVLGSDIVQDELFKCLFCEFSNELEIVAHTHEVLLHADELHAAGWVDADDETDIPKNFGKAIDRYFIHGKQRGSVCKLCGCACYINGVKRSHTHLLRHAHKSRTSVNECHYCTFASIGCGVHSGLHNKFDGVYLRKEIFIAAKKLVRGESYNVQDLLLDRTLSKKKSEQKRKEDGFSGEENACAAKSRTRCSYCDFSHTSNVYTLTHEIVEHAENIRSSLSSFVYTNILNRFSGYWEDVDDGKDLCLLCGIDRPADDKKFIAHLRLHAAPHKKYQCKICTYSAAKPTRIYYHEVSHINQVVVSENIKMKEITDAMKHVKNVRLDENNNEVIEDISVEVDMDMKRSSKSDVRYEEEDDELMAGDGNNISSDGRKGHKVCTESHSFTDNTSGGNFNNNRKLAVGRKANVQSPSSLVLSPRTSLGNESVCSGSIRMMSCPICDFVCNERNTIIKHISTHPYE